MKVEPTAVVFVAICSVQTPDCTATAPGPVTAVWGTPRVQIDVCGACIEEMFRRGEWQIEGARLQPLPPRVTGASRSA